MYTLLIDEPTSPTEEGDTNPTPSYNFEILSDVRMQENNELLKKCLSTKPLTESIQMVKLWLLKRGLNTVIMIKF